MNSNYNYNNIMLQACNLATQVPNLQFINGKKNLELRNKKVLLFVSDCSRFSRKFNEPHRPQNEDHTVQTARLNDQSASDFSNSNKSNFR